MFCLGLLWQRTKIAKKVDYKFLFLFWSFLISLLALPSTFTSVTIINSSQPKSSNNLVIGSNKTVYDYIKVGIANPSTYSTALLKGKKAPFFHHAGNYQVDLGAIPLGTEIGVTALLTIFKK